RRLMVAALAGLDRKPRCQARAGAQARRRCTERHRGSAGLVRARKGMRPSLAETAEYHELLIFRGLPSPFPSAIAPPVKKLVTIIRHADRKPVSMGEPKFGPP